jgi:hypothetical protein
MANVRSPLNLLRLITVLCCATAGNLQAQSTAPLPAANEAPKAVRETLNRYCFDCHGNGSSEGGLALDQVLGKFRDPKHHDHWLSVWKNLQAQTMPPADESQPGEAESAAVIQWIERAVFQLDPQNPDPGRVTIRRLNRTEYETTIRDLLNVNFNADDAFPADDTGYGFDTIGDVLTISPLLMEKYLEAAQEIVDDAVPPGGPQVPKRTLSVDSFRPLKKSKPTASRLPFAAPITVQQALKIDYPGRYVVRFEMRAAGSDEATSNTARITMSADGEELKSQEVGWDANNNEVLESEFKFTKGMHALSLSVTPLDPPEKGENRLYLNVRKVQVQGPTDGSLREYPAEFRRVFFEGPPPSDLVKRREYARKILRYFALRAFRRPIDEPTLERLVAMALDTNETPAVTFEQGISRGLTAILVSPRFLFRAEVQPEPDRPARIVPLDEYALASRLSYFLWSSLPDQKLLDLARDKQLRKNLASQVNRMIDDPRSSRLVENFVGQWLQTRDVETVTVDARRILNLQKFEDGQRVFNRAVRKAMRLETELLFEHLLRKDLSVLEMLTADYTFLNEPLAEFYGIDGVDGDKMRLVPLTPGAHRGGLLTQGSFLVVTSNPTITSPVKRGLFVLDNLLGTPAPPPPPNVPPFDEKAVGRGRKLTLRELMERHRKDALCASCHSRMDPIGLSLETYNALGIWRESELGKPIITAGQLITGEKFADTRELGKVIASKRRRDFYRCLAEKMLTYAIGRGVEYYDATTIDALVQSLERDGGKLRTLIHQIVLSAPFDKRRGDGQLGVASIVTNRAPKKRSTNSPQPKPDQSNKPVEPSKALEPNKPAQRTDKKRGS